jgi:hypothetical protein
MKKNLLMPVMMAGAAAVIAVAGTVAPAHASTVASHSVTPATAKKHYVGSCHSSGDFPICSISTREIFDVNHIYVHVWGSLRRSDGVRSRIDVSYDTLCDKGLGSASDSGDKYGYLTYTHTLPHPYSKPDDCFASAEFSPASFSASGHFRAQIYFTRRDGK